MENPGGQPRPPGGLADNPAMTLNRFVQPERALALARETLHTEAQAVAAAAERLGDAFVQAVTAIISDLCYHYCLDPERKVSISLSKQQIGRKSRYTPKVMGKTLPDILAALGHVAEGVSTTHEVATLAARLGVGMPITNAVDGVLRGKLAAREAVEQLLARDPKQE